jgi:hypothetical protein
MTIGELWDKLAQYPDDMELYIGYIDGHQIYQLEFEIVNTQDTDGNSTLSLMYQDIGIINN